MFSCFFKNMGDGILYPFHTKDLRDIYKFNRLLNA